VLQRRYPPVLSAQFASTWRRRSPGQLGSKDGFLLELKIYCRPSSLRGAARPFVIAMVSVIMTATDMQLWTHNITFAGVQKMIVQQLYSSTPVDLPFLLHTKLIPMRSSAWPLWPLGLGLLGLLATASSSIDTYSVGDRSQHNKT
jgi:hypothetical protein